ncbi:M20 family metallopeptidase [Maledivibacter halophilus]|uniref:Aminobenzoyl-glutamate utilization protein B n=1 Tax=Maledivibacter halophilus TaxID=36842 RepID=A0A1T5J2A0_9FIRM|nr:M20 family metallopeptidase [Maledivibacter halophilus]SKC45637.1 aminobenzoyl-glutamate utilization protein B [Maledivibacter halophilus]
MIDKKRILEVIDQKKDIFTEISDKIWEYAETRFEEFKSVELLSKALEDEGFDVKREIADIPTAVKGCYGSGYPVIGILGEYDALSGLSQKSGISEEAPVIAGGNGHGCGHNILGAASLLAAVAIKDYIVENNIEGTICFYGCPGEEGGSGKTFMAREGVFEDIDVAITWHPGTYNGIMNVNTLANYQVYYKFHGKSSHAAAAPHLGRSALDAVELMNVGVNYLREHIIPEARIHYAVTNTGGTSPNVVQAQAEVIYLIRAPKVSEVDEIYKRVCDIAKGAAMMTGTKCDIIFDKACSNYIPNNTIEKLMYENYKELGTFDFDEKEIKFAREIRATLSDSDKNNDLQMAKKLMGEKSTSEILKELERKDLCDIILPYSDSSNVNIGSTDVGDVSWIVPTAQVFAACYALGTPAHSWQMVAQGASSLAHKGLVTAGKVMAMTALDILTNPKIIENAKKELKEKLDGETYICPIPKGVKLSPIK